MIIESLELSNFRNYEHLKLDLCDKVNLLYGDNAQGKTNILEAIYLCATAKSHRGGKDRELILFGNDESHIKMNVKKSTSNRLDIHIKKNKSKGIAVNGIPVKKISELFGLVNVIFFSPEDLGIIKNGPAERRRFIDLELCQLNKLYVNSLISYNKVLLQRNKLLKELSSKPDWSKTLEVWDLQLIKYGKEIIKYREQFVKDLNLILASVHNSISGGKEELTLVYEKNVEIKDYEEMVSKSLNSDLKQKFTQVGPHRDDLGFIVKNNKSKISIDLKRYGSQGQQRTAALSLKLAEIELVKNIIKDYPILLLDDVLSELDFNRQTHLLKSIQHIQTIITGTGLKDFKNINLPLDKVFKVENGFVTQELAEN